MSVPDCLYCSLIGKTKKARQLATDGDDYPRWFCTQHHAYLWAKRVLSKTTLYWEETTKKWESRTEKTPTPVAGVRYMPSPS